MNKEIQALADAEVRKYGYFCASYLGRKGEEFVFATRYSDSEPRLEGLPNVVVIKDMEARYIHDIESFHYLDIPFRDYARGHAIYRDYERKVAEDDFANEAERRRISDIVHNQMPGYDVPVPKDQLYDYLEIAERLGLKAVLTPCEGSMERCDGWEYCIRLSSDTLDEVKIIADSEELPFVSMLYSTAFPEEEQVPWEHLLRLTDEMPLDFTAYFDLDTFVGFTIVLPRPDYNWFWYFAVSEELRGEGYGQKILSRLIERYDDKRIILDMESPRQECDNMEQRQRRNAFYLRNGFRDTKAEKTFEGVTYTILMKGEGTFTVADYDNVLNELRKFWTLPTEDKL